MNTPINPLLTIAQQLPEQPGIYRYYNDKQQLLYVGKARNLKKRVSSYFAKTTHSARISLMVQQIARIEISVTRSESEALLLENNLIKSLKPRFNILFRDDKSYPYLKISHHPFAQIAYHRGALDQHNHYFGPFPNVWAVKQSIKIVQKIFLLRVCENHVFSHRTRPCLLYQIHCCSAPCVGKISQPDYAEHMHTAIKFLNGQHSELRKNLEKKMKAYAQTLAFEKAARVRNQLTALSHVLEQQSVQFADNIDADIIAVSSQAGFACVNLAMVRGGRHLGDRAFFPDLNEATYSAEHQNLLETEVLEAFIAQHYALFPAPSKIILSHALSPLIEKDLLPMLAARSAHTIALIKKPKNRISIWLETAQNNAQLALQQMLKQKVSGQARVNDLIKILALPCSDANQLKIECFDVSHSSGEAVQAACVVFCHHQMQRTDYRRYNLKGITSGDDYAALRQTLIRHYARVLNSEDALSYFADLVLIDGGQGQIDVARQIFLQAGLPIDRLVGVCKGENRKVGREKLIFADDRPELVLGQESIALMLIAQIRDEAHRFAITGMRAARAKTRQYSQLEEISGIGAKRRQRLIAHFGSRQGVINASLEELAQVFGISRQIAQHIYQTLHPEQTE